MMNLLKVRNALRLTQNQLAEKTGYKQCHISMMERGERTITPKFEKVMRELIIKMRGKEARIEKVLRTRRLNSRW